MRLTLALIAIGFMLAAPSAMARPPEVGASLPDAREVGSAQFQWLKIPLFDAALFTRDSRFSWDRPFALTLTYRQSFRERALLRQTIAEIAKRDGVQKSTLTALNDRLAGCFADVRAGDRITGVSIDRDNAQFYYNGAPRCTVSWPDFRRKFFSIWLAAQGDDDALSAKLRGENVGKS